MVQKSAEGFTAQIMNVFHAIILGIVQGLTEFLPISSSGHLVLFEYFLKIPQTSLSFEIILHIATLIAVIIYFYKDILKITKNELLLLAIGTIPAVLFGLFFQEIIEKAFSSIWQTAIEFAISGLLMILANYLLHKKNSLVKQEISYLHALIIGVWQALAIFPAISRSGATVTGALLLQIDREKAFRFSFLLSIPAILGASVLTLKDFATGAEVFDQQLILAYVTGALFSFAFGLISLAWFHHVIKKATLWHFGAYCLVLSAVLGTHLLLQ